MARTGAWQELDRQTGPWALFGPVLTNDEVEAARSLRISLGAFYFSHKHIRRQQIHKRSTMHALPAPHPGVRVNVRDGEGGFRLSETKSGLVARLLEAKEASGKTFSQIAAECGLTNVYVHTAPSSFPSSSSLTTRPPSA